MTRTAAPWKVSRLGRNGHTAITGADGGSIIADMRDGTNTDADANLISAAPDLYTVLDAIVSLVSAMQAVGDKSQMDGSKTLDEARAALAKARGDQ